MDVIQQILSGMLREALEPSTAAVAIAVIGLNIHFGFTGLLNMGQSAFMLLGAYGFAISISRGVPMFFAILIGFLVAGIFAIILGAPTLKLRGDYLAIVTISAAEIIRYVGRSALLTDFTGAAQGIPGSTYRAPFQNLSFLPNEGTLTLIDAGGGAVKVVAFLVAIGVAAGMIYLGRAPIFTGGRKHAVVAALGVLFVILMMMVFPLTYQWTGVNGWWARLVAWSVVGVCVIFTYLLVRSPWGRLLRGIREDEDAIRSLGKNVFAVKMQALIIGGMLGALGGMIYVLPSTVQPDAMGRSLTFFAWTALLLGGAASIFGPVLGTILFYALRIGVKGVAGAVIPNEVMNNQQTDQFSFVVVGVLLMLLVIFRPQGILGNKRELRFNV